MLTVLMSVYAKETPDALGQALESLCMQTVAPAEVVLVKDGPLPPTLDETIERYWQRLPLTVHPLERNVGLARALNAGLGIVRTPWVMRFDSDDVCLPDRVAEQQAMAESGVAGIFGAQIEEFVDDPAVVERARVVPCSHAEIVAFARRRNPFNHMTVCFRRDLVTAAGGYPTIAFFEDYALWGKLLASGTRAANSPRVLVRARVGNGMIDRRGGAAYARRELELQRHFVSIGFKGPWAATVDGMLRSSTFMLPAAVRSRIYASLLRR